MISAWPSSQPACCAGVRFPPVVHGREWRIRAAPPATKWEKTEAEMYAEIASTARCAARANLLETRATNTAENIRLSRQLLAERDLRPPNIVIAVKPFMQRRVWATLAVEWPEMPVTLASPEMTLEDYFTDELTPEKIVNIMMGDLQRIWVYARGSWLAGTERIPDEVMGAYRRLIELGFTKHLIPE